MQKLLHCGLLVLALAMLLGAWTVGAAALEQSAVGIGIVTTENGLYVRNKPDTSGEIIAAASGEDALVVLDQQGEWYHVLYNLDEGYVHSDYVQLKQRENVELGDGIITEEKVNLRAGPGTDSGVVATMLKDDTAQIIGFNTGWFKVVYNGQTGYIRSDLMDLTEKPLTNSDGFGFGRDHLHRQQRFGRRDGGRPHGGVAGGLCQESAGLPLCLWRHLDQRLRLLGLCAVCVQAVWLLP